MYVEANSILQRGAFARDETERLVELIFIILGVKVNLNLSGLVSFV